MRKQILVAGFACFSLIAAAQSNQTSGQTSDAPKVARDAASGKATGKKSAHDDWHQQPAVSADQSSAVRESPTKASTGLRESPTKASTGKTTRVAAGDVNGDGSPDKAAGDSAQTDVKAPRDSSTGMASGKRESSAPSVSEVVVTKSSDKAKIVPADLSGDGQADASSASNGAHNTASDVKTPRDASTGMATGKRQHGVIRIQKEVGPSSPKQ